MFLMNGNTNILKRHGICTYYPKHSNESGKLPSTFLPMNRGISISFKFNDKPYIIIPVSEYQFESAHSCTHTKQWRRRHGGGKTGVFVYFLVRMITWVVWNEESRACGFLIVWPEERVATYIFLNWISVTLNWDWISSNNPNSKPSSPE